MTRSPRFLTAFLAVMLFGVAAVASSLVNALTPAQHLAKAVAVLRGTVLRTESFRDETDGQIYTRAWVRVDEVFKAHCPPILLVVHRGGNVGNVGYYEDSNPDLRVGEERLLFLGRRPNGTLYALNGSASAIRLSSASPSPFGSANPAANRSHWAMLEELRRAAKIAVSESVIDQAGLLVNTVDTAPSLQSAPANFTGTVSNLDIRAGFDSAFNEYDFPTRFIAPDRAATIPYIIDATVRPTNISSNQVLFAVQAALRAWSDACGINFLFEGWTNFGNASAAQTNRDGSSRLDGKLRIQVHNTNNYVLGNDVVGLGGRFYLNFVPLSGWGCGGNVNGCEFHLAQAGAIILQHTYSGFQNTNRLAETLCHEVGHVLGLAHSSEMLPETNAILYDSIMYGYTPHTNNLNRGAVLGVMDGPDIRQIHPTNNTPPFTDYRIIDVVKGTNGQPTNAGINQVELRGYDLQGSDLVLDYTLDSGGNVNGTFALNGTTLSFTPFTTVLSQPRQDPADVYGTNYGRAFVRFLDGTNASAIGVIRVISINEDQYPGATSDGLPDSWMYTYFGTVDPTAGPRLGPNDDFDGDGYTNIEEYLMGSNPADPRSNLQILSFGSNFVSFQARPFDVYELLQTTDLTTWTRVGYSYQPTTTNGLFTNFYAPNPSARFLRVHRVP